MLFYPKKKNMLKKRWSAKTPKFWKNVQKVGIVLGAIGGAIMTAPVTLPAAVVTTAGYLIATGGVIATMSQMTVEDLKELEESQEDGIEKGE
jgi:ABC-type xylose transport system permease subunit